MNPARRKGVRSHSHKQDTYGITSWRARVSAGSLLAAMFPEPPRPVVMTGFLSVGVSRSLGPRRGDLDVSPMLPAPPRPVDCMGPVMVSRKGVNLAGR
jgi:hypothetical protein